MLQFEPFELDDLAQIDVQERHRLIAANIVANPEKYRALMETAWAWTGWDSYGRPVAAGGWMECGAGWMFFGADQKRHMLRLTRFTIAQADAFEKATGKPAFMQVDTRFSDAIRWAKALGFAPLGRDNVWVRIP